MEGFRFRLASQWWLLLLLSLLHRNLELCFSINDEGRALSRFRERVEIDPYAALSDWVAVEGAGDDPCDWFGVECDGGRVIVLNLKDLCLKGTLAPELGKLAYLKSLILHNNSFYGIIPKEFGELQELEILDIGYNNLSGPLPSVLGDILPLRVLVLRSNQFLGSMTSEHFELTMLSDLEIDGKLSSSRRSPTRNVGFATITRFLQSGPENSRKRNRKHKTSSRTRSFPPSPRPSPRPSPPAYPPPAPIASTPPSPALSLRPMLGSPPPSPADKSANISSRSPSSNASQARNTIMYVGIGLGAFSLFSSFVLCILLCQGNKVVNVRPWTTGLSGQLQKAFVTGVPSLERTDIETACEDFSNIIGSLSDCMLYKGTLSSGVEIAVTSTVVTSAKDWSKYSEAQFRKKIATLSKVNHKNFVNLLGYCEEEEPFTRMMVFEYAPNGTLFEHLHIKEAEHLNWAARLRIAMGIAYCLDHMNQLNPPVLRNPLSTSIYLTDDFAAKVSDFEFWSETTVAETTTGSSDPLATQSPRPEDIVYKFGILLLEIISGRLPYSEDGGLLLDWASDYLDGLKPLTGMVDTTLRSFREVDVIAMCEVIRHCCNPEPQARPSMKDVAARLRGITSVSPDGATPRLSPLWWAELEIVSTEAN